MRKKGRIWQNRYQQIIVSRYKSGMPVSRIRELPELQRVQPSEYLIREILKENNVEPTWVRAKVKEEVWQPEVIEFIVDRRTRGDSFTEITKAVDAKFPNRKLSRSTVVRIVEEEGPQPKVRGLTEEEYNEIAEQIVLAYEQGLLVREIRKQPTIRRHSLSEHQIRSILKQEGVQLTGRKGSLRRWPQKLQDLVADLYKRGKTFDEIKEHPDIAANKPTDYAIRTILKKRGIVTRKPSYLRPISIGRFRRYRDNKLSEKEVSLIHKHLARFEDGRHRMLERIGLSDISVDDIECLDEEQRTTLRFNAKRWQGFFHWGMQFLYDDTLKQRIFQYGLELSRAVNYLRKACEDRDSHKLERGNSRIFRVTSEMHAMQRELLTKPAELFQVELPPGEEPA